MIDRVTENGCLVGMKDHIILEEQIIGNIQLTTYMIIGQVSPSLKVSRHSEALTFLL
jgi:hypothetical protein